MCRGWIAALIGVFLTIATGCSRETPKPAGPARTESIALEPDEILISIDGHDLTYGQAIRQVERRLGGPPPEGMDPARIAQIERRTFATVVDEFIRRELLLAEARRLGIEPEEDQIALALDTIEKSRREGQPPPSGMFYEGPDSLRQEVVAGLTIEKLLVRELPPFQEPSDAAIEEYLQQFPDFRTIPARARARHIFLAVPSDADETRVAQLTANLEDTRTRLQEGTGFAQTAQMISQDRSATRGGDLGILVKGRGDPAIEGAVFSQPIGEIGPVVRSSAGLHLIQVLERTEPRHATREEIVEMMRRSHRAEALAAYIRTLRQHIEMRHSPAIQPITETP